MKQSIEGALGVWSDGPGPLHRKLSDALRAAAKSGRLPAGERLPSERELAERLNVSRSTLRQALKDLAQQGLVATRPGAGTIVVGRIPKALSRLSGFTEDMQLRGLVGTSRIIEFTRSQVGADAAFRTGLPLGTEVFTLVRLRLAGGEPIAYERATVPVSVATAPGGGAAWAVRARASARLAAVNNNPARRVIRGERDRDLVAQHDADAVLAQLAAEVREDRPRPLLVRSQRRRPVGGVGRGVGHGVLPGRVVVRATRA